MGLNQQWAAMTSDQRKRCTRSVTRFMLIGFLILLAFIIICKRSFGQDIGVVAPRTFVKQAFNAVACSSAPQYFVVPDRGLTTHMVVYTTSGTINSIDIGIQGTFDTSGGFPYVDIVPSESITHPVGSNFAKIYMPFVRIALKSCSGSGTVTAWYSGTWALNPWASQLP